jgi:hypothetical protein
MLVMQSGCWLILCGVESNFTQTMMGPKLGCRARMHRLVMEGWVANLETVVEEAIGEAMRTMV